MGILQGLWDSGGRREVPEDAADDLIALPGSDELDEDRFMEFSVEYLRDSVEVGDEHWLQNDAHIRGEEQLDWNFLYEAAIFLVDELEVGWKTLQVYQ